MDPLQKKLLDGLNQDEIDAIKESEKEKNNKHVSDVDNHEDVVDTQSIDSGKTSGADECSDKEEVLESSSDDDSEENTKCKNSFYYSNL